MGDRYILDKNCVHCGKLVEDIWYAPTSSSYTFICEKCKKANFIKSNFEVIKIKDVKLKDIRDGFEMTTMGTLTEKQIDEACKGIYKQVKR